MKRFTNNKITYTRFEKIKYENVIALSNLKKSLLNLLANINYWGVSSNNLISLKDLIKFQKLLKKNTIHFVPQNLNKNKKQQLLYIILLKTLANELTPIIETKLTPLTFGFRPFLHTKSALKFFKQNFKKSVWFIKINFSNLITITHYKLFINKIKKIVDQQTLNLIIKLINTNYINFNLNYQNLHYLLKNLSNEQKILTILSPLFLNFFFHELDIFILSLQTKKYMKTNKVQNNNIFLNPFAKLKKSKNKNNNLSTLHFLNFYFFNFFDNYYNSNLIFLKIKHVLQKNFFFSCIPSLESSYVFKIKNFFFLGYRVNINDNKVFLELSEKIFENYLLEQNIIKINKNLIKPQAIIPFALKTDNEILEFFSFQIKLLYFFYWKSPQNKILSKFLYFYKKSCALTLAVKYKLQTTRQVYKKFTKKLIILQETGRKKLFFPTRSPI